MRTRGAWYNFNRARELKLGPYVKNNICWFKINSISKVFCPTSKTSTAQYISTTKKNFLPPSPPSRRMIPPQYIMISRMRPASKTQVRNLQCPLSMTSGTGSSWFSSYYERELKFGKHVRNHIWWYSYKSPYISAIWSHIFANFSVLVPESPQNYRYILNCAHLLQIVALFFSLIILIKRLKIHSLCTICASSIKYI